ncbi:hypothetical protein D3C71_881030 [compost metagenome]
MDAQAEFVEVARRPAAGVDDAHGAVLKLGGHGEAVIGVEIVDADLVALIFVEGLQPREDALHITARAIGGEVENVDADITQNTV